MEISNLIHTSILLIMVHTPGGSTSYFFCWEFSDVCQYAQETLFWRQTYTSVSIFTMCLWISDPLLWFLADPWETAPAKASQFLEVGKYWAKCTAFICKPTDPEPTSQHFISGSPRPLTFWVPSTYPNHSRARCQLSRNSPWTPEAAEMIQTSQAWACFLCSPILSFGNHRKGYCPCISLSLSLLSNPTSSPHVSPVMACLSPLWL